MGNKKRSESKSGESRKPQELSTVGELELTVDEPLQELAWKLERLCWLLMGIVITLGLAGLFGKGPLSTATAGAPPLLVEYERFSRQLGETRLQVLVEAPENTTRLRLALSRSYTEQARIEQIHPQPLQQELGPDAVTYTFVVSGPSAKFTFFVRPLEPGFLDGELRIDDGGSAAFRHFIYP